MLRKVAAGMVFVLALVSPIWAQEPAADAKKIAELERQVGVLIKQRDELAKKLEQPPPSAADRLAQQQKFYAETFRRATEQAEPACKAVKGKLRISVTGQTVTITCER